MAGSGSRPLPWLERLPLGWRPGSDRRAFGFGQRPPEYLWSDEARHVGIVCAPTQSGKSTGLLAPGLMTWDGPAIATSTKTDLRDWTGRRRQQLAQAHGGEVMVYDALAEGVGGCREVGFNLIEESKEPREATRIAQALVFASGTGKGVSDATHWREKATATIEGCLHAAAWGGRDIQAVRRWLQSGDLEGPAHVLEASDSPVGRDWAGELRGIEMTADKEKSSILSAARGALACLKFPEVQRSVSLPAIDWETFLATKSTLYIYGPAEEQELVAPLTAALIERAYRAQKARWPIGKPRRGEPRLLLALDELTNTAPIKNVAPVASEGAGQGTTLLWSVQGRSQVVERYGAEPAKILEQNSRAKIVMGGAYDRSQLDDVSAMIGDIEVERTSTSTNRGGDGHSTGRSVSVSTERRRAWPVERLQRGLREGQILLLNGRYEPEVLNLPIAPRDEPWKSHCGPAGSA